VTDGSIRRNAMDKKQRAARRSQAEWEAILEDYVQSGMSMMQYAKLRDISYGSLVNWKRKLLGSEQSVATELCELSESASPMGGTFQNLVITVKNLVTISLHGELTEKTRRELTVLIRELCA
jgi:hypothetical protein